MGRFLTPARICLLALVRAYQAGQASSESTLPVLDFLASQIVTLAEHNQKAVHEHVAISSPDISFFANRLRQWSSRHPGRSMYDVLLRAVWTLHGADSIYTLVQMQNVEDSEIDPRSLTPASPLGQFVRRCYVEYARMQFDDTQILWKSFAAYRASTYGEWEKKNVGATASLESFQDQYDVPRAQSGHDLKVVDEKLNGSALDAEVLIGFAIHHLQKMGGRVPDDVKSQLQRWIGEQYESDTQALQHFMSFFEHWRAGQYTMALESLHRYFDYSLVAHSRSTDNVKAHYQYALLHLSVLHADFECWEESVDAMNECIATARENQDPGCLNFALSWLLYLRHAHPEKGRSPLNTIAGVVGSGGDEHDEITFLKQKAREGKHWMLLSSTLLEEAKLEMYNGGSSNRAQEHILQAMHLHIQHDLRSLISAALLFQGASLDRLGQTHLADRYYELPNTVHIEHCPYNDRVRSTCRIAYKLAQSGLYSRAIDLLSDLTATAQGVLKLEQRIKAFAALCQLRRSLHRDGREAARHHFDQLKPLRSGSDPEIVFEIHMLEIELLMKHDRLEEALSKVNERLEECKGRSIDLGQRLHLLLLKSKIFAAGGQASKGFGIALRATSTAERHTVVPVFLDGLAVLARILIDLSEFQMARDVLEAVLPKALESHAVELQAQLYVAIGEAHVGLAGHACESGSAEQTRNMRKAQAFIENGLSAYRRIEDLNGMLDCLIMKSKIATWDGDESTAAQADDMYMQLLADK